LKTLREKISLKFTPRIALSSAQKTNKSISKLTPVSIDKVPPSFPLSVKMAKEVNVISKYFQNKKYSNNNKNKENPKTTKSYAQVSKTPANMAKVLIIKKAFPAFNVEKID